MHRRLGEVDPQSAATLHPHDLVRVERALEVFLLTGKKQSVWLAEHGFGWDELLYVGNDVNDLGPIGKAGLSACPSDAHPSVLGVADWVLPLPGGQGALRAMSDALMARVG